MSPAQRDITALEVSSRLYQEARDALNHGDLEVATAKFRESAKQAPHFKTYEMLGECLLKCDQLEEAVLYLSASAGLGNRQYRSRYLLAQTLIRLGDPVSAAEKLQEAVQMQPAYKAARTLLDKLLTEDAQVAVHFAED